MYEVCGSSFQFSPLTDRVVLGDMGDDSAEILFPLFSAGGPCKQYALASALGKNKEIGLLGKTAFV